MVTIRIGDTQEDLTWEQWEDRVKSGRIPPDALVRFEPVTGTEFVAAVELDLFRSLNDDSRRDWADRYRSGSPPWMTALLAGAQIRLWWLIFTASAMWAVDSLQLFQPFVYEDGQVWRLITAGLTHSDPGHIASNLVMFIYVGWFLERALGRTNLFVIFMASVIGGSVLSITMTPGTGSIGSSGGVLGVVAAATVFGFVRFGLLPDRARIIFGWALLPYLAMIFMMGWWSESTDNWAHTGGLVTGAVLALLLDPPGLERKRRWNAVIWTTTGLAITGILGLMWLAGPLLIQTADVDRWDKIAKSPRIYDDLTWTAPTTWRRTNTTAGMGFASQADPRRFWVVTTRTRTTPATPSGELADWRDDVEAEWAEHATFSEPESSSIGGHPGLYQVATLGSPPNQIQEHWVAVRGSYVLAATWSVDIGGESRLQPVREKVISELIWDEPAKLVEAKELVERKPKNRPLQRRLATELSLAGEVAQARELWQALIDERPTTPDGWVGLLELERVSPQAAADSIKIYERALTALDSPEVQAAVALALYDQDPDTARGLLEVAWIRSPGDRHLRRARKTLGLPTELHELIAAHLWFEPFNGAPLTAPRLAAQPPEPNLAAAKSMGRSMRADRDLLIDAALAQKGAKAVVALCVLRNGRVPDLQELASKLRDTARDIAGMQAGREVSWLDPIEEERLLDLLPITDATVASLVAPAGADEQAFLPYLEGLGLRAVDGPRGPALQRY